MTTKTKQVCKIGDTLPGQWIVAGVSPHTGIPYSVLGGNSAKHTSFVFHGASSHVEKIRDWGIESVRLPSEKEMKAIFANAANDKHPAFFNLVMNRDHWTSTLDPDGGHGHFRKIVSPDGSSKGSSELASHYACFVRDEPDIELQP